LTIYNTSTSTRTFSIYPTQDHYRIANCIATVKFELSENEGVILTREARIAIEKLEQKLKIATRKNQPQKIAKIERKLALLQSGNNSVVDDNDDSSTISSSINDDDRPMTDLKSSIEAVVKSNRSQTIKLHLDMLVCGNEGGEAVEQLSEGQIPILVHERHNADDCRDIWLTFTFDPSAQPRASLVTSPVELPAALPLRLVSFLSFIVSSITSFVLKNEFICHVIFL
jgi:hypothetical protein